jgi:hypothetical protein
MQESQQSELQIAFSVLLLYMRFQWDASDYIRVNRVTAMSCVISVS